jgi:2',3'-cyclic-nucleotide 2'-phosphodiesterase (5'-nucleotidase family)
MGNWVIDAMMNGANTDGLHADFAIANYGGMRVPVITTGPFTMGEIYELSPFENMLVIVDVPGNLVDSLFQLIASRGGWPVSANVRLVIGQKQLISATINGSRIDPGRIYQVAMPDYVANGGDDAHFLIPLPRTITTKTQRSTLIRYAADTARSGNTITSNVEGRIITQ